MAKTTKKFRVAALMLLAGLVFFAAGVAAEKDGEKEAPSISYIIKGKSVLAVEATGKTLWEAKLRFAPEKVEKLDDFLIASGVREVVCLAETNGRIRWTLEAKGAKRIKVDGGKFYIGVADYVYLVNPATGKVGWRYYVGGEKIIVFEIFDGDCVYVLTDKRAAFVSTKNGKAIATEFLKGRKLNKSARYGSVLLLEFAEELMYFDATNGKKTATKKIADFAKWKAKTPAQALEGLVKLLGVSSRQAKAKALVDMHFVRTKDGNPWVLELVVSNDEDIQAKVPAVMGKFAAMTLDKSVYVAGTANAVLNEMISADNTGKFEMAYITAVMLITPEEAPNPAALLLGLIKMLVLGDVQMRAHTISMLKDLTGEDFGFKPEGTFEERRDSIAEWEKWYQENAPRFDWDMAKRKIIITKT